jgi:hypothetical protein
MILNNEPGNENEFAFTGFTVNHLDGQKILLQGHSDQKTNTEAITGYY